MTIDLDPVAFRLFGASVHWYGLMYVFGFCAFYWLALQRMGRHPEQHAMGAVLREGLLYYAIIGVIIGGRLGYVLFYAPEFYLSRPLEILKVWEGGMSFHGGLVGVIVALWLVARASKVPFWAVADFVAPLVPPGLGFGRLGNFINGELWGRPTELPWGMVFVGGGDVSRHPSQLYELALEGVVLFVALKVFSGRPRPVAQVSGMFLLLYGLFRFGVEFTRAPDLNLGLLALGLSMGQWLSLPMVVLGAALLVYSRRREVFQYRTKPAAHGKRRH